MIKSGDVVRCGNGTEVQVGVVLREYKISDKDCIEFEGIDQMPYISEVSDIRVLDRFDDNGVVASDECAEQVGNILCTLEDNKVNMNDSLVYIARVDVDEFRLIANGYIFATVTGNDGVRVSPEVCHDCLFTDSVEGIISNMLTWGYELCIFPSKQSYVQIDDALMFRDYGSYRSWLEYLVLSNVCVVVSSFRYDGSEMYSCKILDKNWNYLNSDIILNPSSEGGMFIGREVDLHIPSAITEGMSWSTLRSVQSKSFIGVDKSCDLMLCVTVVF